MKFWNRIKAWFYKKQLTEQLQTIKATRNITNLADAKTIGIVYDSSNAANDTAIAEFAERLRTQGKTTDILGYVADPKIESKPGIAIFNKNKLNWAGVPDDETVTSFTSKNFDLLLDCHTGELPPLEYISITSKAKWRVGPYAAGKTDCYDMMVNMGPNTGVKYFIEQAEHFLNEIKY